MEEEDFLSQWGWTSTLQINSTTVSCQLLYSHYMYQYCMIIIIVNAILYIPVLLYTSSTSRKKKFDSKIMQGFQRQKLNKQGQDCSSVPLPHNHLNTHCMQLQKIPRQDTNFTATYVLQEMLCVSTELPTNPNMFVSCHCHPYIHHFDAITKWCPS